MTCVLLYLPPLSVMTSPFFLQITVVAGLLLEMQVRVCEEISYAISSIRGTKSFETALIRDVVFSSRF